MAKGYLFWRDQNGSGLIGAACADCRADMGVGFDEASALSSAKEGDQPQWHREKCPRRKGYKPPPPNLKPLARADEKAIEDEYAYEMSCIDGDTVLCEEELKRLVARKPQ